MARSKEDFEFAFTRKDVGRLTDLFDSLVDFVEIVDDVVRQHALAVEHFVSTLEETFVIADDRGRVLRVFLEQLGGDIGGVGLGRFEFANALHAVKVESANFLLFRKGLEERAHHEVEDVELVARDGALRAIHGVVLHVDGRLSTEGVVVVPSFPPRQNARGARRRVAVTDEKFVVATAFHCIVEDQRLAGVVARARRRAARVVDHVRRQHDVKLCERADANEKAMRIKFEDVGDGDAVGDIRRVEVVVGDDHDEVVVRERRQRTIESACRYLSGSRRGRNGRSVRSTSFEGANEIVKVIVENRLR